MLIEWEKFLLMSEAGWGVCCAVSTPSVQAGARHGERLQSCSADPRRPQPAVMDSLLLQLPPLGQKREL
ncbi:hypothetical protein ROHU_014317 [Labeo rohita]|uniref:Uncharacterized protein n=1 Tax=Labeo rohita TaxID=84645 RepID=A0A498NV14_LABRO|nr:hypothetical protein ROHU_014317 [Labeo rohita]